MCRLHLAFPFNISILGLIIYQRFQGEGYWFAILQYAGIQAMFTGICLDDDRECCLVVLQGGCYEPWEMNVSPSGVLYSFYHIKYLIFL